MSTVLTAICVLSGALLIYTQAGYGLLLLLLKRIKSSKSSAESEKPVPDPLPTVSLIVAAYNEESVIAEKVKNLKALNYPAELLEVIVCCDGCSDQTASQATEAGADKVLELPRGGKIRAQDAGVKASQGEVTAFSDANSVWSPDALIKLVSELANPQVGYVCGKVSFTSQEGTNQEGLYWRYELWLRSSESALYSVTAGNGAIYATRRETYLEVDPVMGHDLSFPFNMVKRGLRALYQPAATAEEKMVPSIDGEFARKRRMMSHTWPILFKGGLLSPKGYPAIYALMLLSHRLLRYSTPFLHALFFVSSGLLVTSSLTFLVLFTGQIAVGLAALLASWVKFKPALIARYYLLTTAAIGLGLIDWLRHGTEASWELAEGTR